MNLQKDCTILHSCHQCARVLHPHHHLLFSVLSFHVLIQIQFFLVVLELELRVSQELELRVSHLLGRYSTT
jgi:hypothetical protein